MVGKTHLFANFDLLTSGFGNYRVRTLEVIELPGRIIIIKIITSKND